MPVSHTRKTLLTSAFEGVVLGIVRRIRARGQPIQTQFQVPHLAVSAATKPPYCISRKIGSSRVPASQPGRERSNHAASCKGLATLFFGSTVCLPVKQP